MDKQDELARIIGDASEGPGPLKVRRLTDNACAEIAAAVRAYLESAKVESAAVEACRADPFCDDARLLGTTQQELRMAHYARAALAAIGGQDGRS